MLYGLINRRLSLLSKKVLPAVLFNSSRLPSCVARVPCHYEGRCVYFSLLEFPCFRHWGNTMLSTPLPAPVEQHTQRKCRCDETMVFLLCVTWGQQLTKPHHRASHHHARLSGVLYLVTQLQKTMVLEMLYKVAIVQPPVAMLRLLLWCNVVMEIIFSYCSWSSSVVLIFVQQRGVNLLFEALEVSHTQSMKQNWTAQQV